ncbi:hypothetical protein ACFTAO_12695 [Paenibacillus rhizoplanae]
MHTYSPISDTGSTFFCVILSFIHPRAHSSAISAATSGTLDENVSFAFLSSFLDHAAPIDNDSAADWNGSRRRLTGYERGSASRGLMLAADT